MTTDIAILSVLLPIILALVVKILLQQKEVQKLRNIPPKIKTVYPSEAIIFSERAQFTKEFIEANWRSQREPIKIVLLKELKDRLMYSLINSGVIEVEETTRDSNMIEYKATIRVLKT